MLIVSKILSTGYLVVLVLKDSLYGDRLVSVQIFGLAHNSKRAVADDVQVAEAERLWLVFGVTRINRVYAGP